MGDKDGQFTRVASLGLHPRSPFVSRETRPKIHHLKHGGNSFRSATCIDFRCSVSRLKWVSDSVIGSRIAKGST
ncbi:Epidermal patterning factor-like protein [Psidium guajava]|nr:Epidermal patterning factor-like protein [Psidium guajava]